MKYTPPTSFLMQDIHPQHILNNLVNPLFLSICLQMISMLKSNFFPKTANNSFQNLEVNLASPSDMIFLGIP